MVHISVRNIYLLICLCNFCYCYEPITTTISVLGAIAASSLYMFRCNVQECCQEPWIRRNVASLENSFKDNLFGQHLAEVIIPRSLKGFLSKKNPMKALVMSFHGRTGSGKNFVSNIIAESIYKEGLKSQYFHLYIANKDFPHKAEVSAYQDKLRSDVIKFTKQCERNLFVFDEVDKMPEGTLDSIKPFLDYHEDVDGVDYRKNIFIFISNSGAQTIDEVTLRFWANGNVRERITMKDVEPHLSRGTFNEKGGLQYSELLSSELIDIYVPFLPLEKKHVKQCIAAELKRQKATRSYHLIDQVADELVYFPPQIELYSKSGCKRISQKIDTFQD